MAGAAVALEEPHEAGLREALAPTNAARFLEDRRLAEAADEPDIGVPEESPTIVLPGDEELVNEIREVDAAGACSEHPQPRVRAALVDPQQPRVAGVTERPKVLVGA